MSGLACILKWIDEHAVNPMETATFLVNTNKELQEERNRLKEEKRELQRVVGIKEAALDGLRSERDRIRRVLELRDIRIETLAEDVRAARQDRDKLREELGNLLSAIDQWKIKSGLY
jgi:chromosome segregation ATPase